MPELSRLRVFLVVAEELHFTRAAARLHLAQQAVSRSVAQLERDLGVRLLDRTTHHVSLTEAGRALVESGREAVDAVDRAFRRARAVDGEVSRTVRVGVSPAVGAQVRSEIADALCDDDAAPTRVSFVEVWPDRMASMLRDRSVDLAIARTMPSGTGVAAAELAPTPAELHAPRSHRRAREGDRIRLARLDGERLLCWEAQGTPYTDRLVGIMAGAGARVTVVVARVRGAGQAPDLAAQDAVALVPQGWERRDDVVTVPLVEQVELPLLLLWSGSRPLAEMDGTTRVGQAGRPGPGQHPPRPADTLTNRDAATRLAHVRDVRCMDPVGSERSSHPSSMGPSERRGDPGGGKRLR